MSITNFEKDFQRLQGSLKKIANALNDTAVTIRLARKCREIVYRRVKSGYGVDSDADAVANVNRKALKPLSQSYKDYRNGLVAFYTTKSGKVVAIKNKDFAASVVAGKTTKGRGKAGTGSHTKIRFKTTAFHHVSANIQKPKLGEFGRPNKSNLTLTGQMLRSLTIKSNGQGFQLFINDSSRKRPDGSADPLTNKQVAEYVSKERPFMALTDGEVRILKRECEKIIEELIKKLIR